MERRRLEIAARLAVALCILVGGTPMGAASADLASALEVFVRDRAPHPPTDVALPSLEDFVLAESDGVEVELSASSREDFLGRVPITVAVSEDGRELKRGVVTVRVRADRPVLVAARNLRRGDELRAADMRLERHDVSELGGGWLTDASSVTGKRVRRNLHAGTPLRSAWIEVAPQVSRGERVRLQLSRGALRIEGRGEARADGREGEWIPVLNIDSRRELLGRVTGDGVVHVEF